jgi:hypothetical protein
MAVIALIVSIVAVLLAGWGGWSAHQSARSSDSSARSAAEAVDLERSRQHLDQTPHILLEESVYGDPGEGVWFKNGGPLDYDSVRFTFAVSDRPGPLVSFQVNDQWATSGDLGPMAVGDRRLLSYRRSESREAESTLRLRVMCSKGSETWRVPVEVEITPEANVL